MKVGFLHSIIRVEEKLLLKELRRRADVEVVRMEGQPFGTHFDLLGGFFTGKVQRLQAAPGEFSRHLEHESRFTDTGIPSDQHKRSGDKTAAQGPVKFHDVGFEPDFRV